ncbi:hypothetical protein APR11_002837 [Nocardia amikacinitolerans]|uniref:DUF5682 family protein n=1 Tax=Nocardia amikacinitolerans TaxID=756689 RepID=UPI0020A588F4|nr:DUF5682 family protein [Nocardia amikacinitolerans]MCP2296409.1 hypothetical protein [Nocardia amikacinitolerans]
MHEQPNDRAPDDEGDAPVAGNGMAHTGVVASTADDSTPDAATIGSAASEGTAQQRHTGRDRDIAAAQSDADTAPTRTAAPMDAVDGTTGAAEVTVRRTRARTSGSADEAVARVFGIRHHGPGSARSLRMALEHFQPDTILIEGPADADHLVGFVTAEGMAPPVALLAYVPDQPARAAFWPYAVFSPEWQALRYAAEHEVPVRFCDLPGSVVLAAEVEPGDSVDPLAHLAAAAGYDDAERWWDAVVESTTDIDVFDALTEAMGVLREAPDRDPHESEQPHPGSSAEQLPALETFGPDDEFDSTAPPIARRRRPTSAVVDAHTLRREAYMRQTMRKALKGGSRRLAVVCGAWHAPALAGKLGPAAPDARLLKGMPKVKATVTWVPYTHSRLAASSGYGAGVDSPGWYHHLFTAPDRPIARWLTKVAGVLRAHDLPVSSAHVIEAVRLAETLATLRQRPLAGLSEVTEAVRAVMCGGDETMVHVVTTELVVGEALGAVPENAPTVPLDADLRAKVRRLRMKLEPTARTVDLDLRKERELERSRLLHRLRLLGVEWGTPTTGEVRSTGTFRETWTLKWRPEFAVSVIEASRWGTTLRTAAETKILDTAQRQDRTLADLAGALELALLADLGGATSGLIQRLETVAALDHDVTHLLAALPGLIRTLRYGDVRGTDTKALAHVADGLLVRIAAGLPGAVTGLDADAAAELRTQLDAAHLAIHTRDDAWATETWLAALRKLADREDVHGALVGRAVRLLSDAGIIDDADSGRRLSAALSVGATPASKAAWIDGFLGGRGLLLVHDRELLRRIDEWLRGLDDEQFLETLPVLRRTFGAFESGERRAIGRAIHDTAGLVTTEQAGVDVERGRRAMRTAADILGVAR